MMETEHKRRVRYSGKYPRKFEEKYKEQNPEKYADTVARVIEKGSTPAGMHISIMVKEIIDFLQIKPGQKGLDATLGYGGHTSAMLNCLEGKGHVYALDVDPIESAKTKERLLSKGYGPDIVTVKLTNFANVDKVAEDEHGDMTGLHIDSQDEEGYFKYRGLPKDSYKLGIITDPRQMGGYPEYHGTPRQDADGDGMPDEWERKNGLNPNDPSDANGDCNGDGYTNIEKYINGINTDTRIDWRNLDNNYDTLAEKGSLM